MPPEKPPSRNAPVAHTPSSASSHICVYLISFRAFFALLLDVAIELRADRNAHNEPDEGPSPRRYGRRRHERCWSAGPIRMAAVERGLAGDRCGSGTSAAGEFGLPQSEIRALL